MKLVVKFQGQPFKEVPLEGAKISVGSDAADDVHAGTAARIASAPARRAAAETSPKRKKAAPAANNLVAKLARLPKPVLFAGFSFLMILILALKVLTSTSDEPPPTRLSTDAG